MLYIYSVIYLTYMIYSVSSMSNINPKLCINCKYYSNNLNNFSKLEVCTLFQLCEPIDVMKIRRNNIKYLVTGIKIEEPITPKEYFLCETARNFDDMCGIAGKKYEPIN